MTKDEALKMAIEALEDNQHYIAENERHTYVMLYNEIIDKCKEALEQPAQEPIYIIGEGWNCDKFPELGTKLYTHPHQWQGLTEKEILIICAKMAAKLPNKEIDIIFARAIEQALKEKNHG